MKYIIIMSIFSFLFGNNSVQDKPIKVLSPEEFKAQIQDKDVQLIDVRTPNEYRNGFIANAENINFKSKDFLSQISKLDKSKPVLLYCSAGGRSAKASIIFDSLGFKEIYDLKGGYLSW